MTLSLMILADGPSADLVDHLGAAATALYARLLGDTVMVARQLPDAHVCVRYNPGAPAAILAGLPPATEVVPTPTVGAVAVAAALADGLARGGPAIVLRGEQPHLPPWRLRDAATHLGCGADAVLGPEDSGSWYLLGLRPEATALLGAVPAPGAPIGAFTAADGHALQLLPPWFGVHTVADLASLAETLRTMPPGVAAGTRGLLEAEQASRAVGG